MKTITNALSIVSLLLLTSCAALFEERTYLSEMERESDGFFVAGRDFPVVAGDSGEAFRSREEIKKRTPASKRTKALEEERVSLEEELRAKLAELDEETREEFYRDSKYLETDSERLYYLSMTGGAKRDYIQTKVAELSEEEAQRLNNREFMKKRSVRASTIQEGMTKDNVVSLWGKPNKVEIAGHPKFENERWTFIEGESVKQIFFEGGKVEGWSLDF